MSPETQPALRHPGRVDAWPLLAFVAAFVLIRFAARFALIALFGGDPVSDVSLYYAPMGASPWGQYLGAVPLSAQYPPLFGLLAAPGTFLIRAGLAPGDAFRMGFALVELCIVIGPARRALAERKWSRAAFWAFCPPLLLASTVFAQDEILSALLLAFALRHLDVKGPAFALAMAFGAVAVKAFFAPLAFLCLLFQSWSTRLAALGILGLGYLGRFLSPAPPPFVPGNAFGVSPWSWSFMSVPPGPAAAPLLKVSLALAALATLLAAFVLIGKAPTRNLGTAVRNLLRGTCPAPDSGMERVLVAYLLVLFVFAYHVNPEYYLLAFMVGQGAALRRREALALLAAATLPYVHNVLHGLAKLPFPHVKEWARAVTWAQDATILLLAALSLVLAIRLLKGSVTGPRTAAG